MPLPRAKRSLWWRDLITNEGKKASKGSLNHVSSRIGSGENTPLWTIKWIGQCPLSTQFPNLFLVHDNKLSSVNNMRMCNDEAWQ